MTEKGSVTNRQIDLMFRRNDTDGDGSLNFKEFKR